MSSGKYIGYITKAIEDLHTRGGVSRQAIKKYINEHEKDATESHIRLALKRGVESGVLKQTGQKFSIVKKSVSSSTDKIKINKKRRL